MDIIVNKYGTEKNKISENIRIPAKAAMKQASLHSS